MSLARRALALLALLGLIAGGLHWTLRPRAFVSQIYAISEDRAALLLRQNTDDATRFWITLQSTDGPVWEHPLPDDTRGVVWSSLTATDAALTYQRYDDASSEVVALALDSGQPIWRTPLGGADDLSPSPFLYLDSRAVGGLLIEPTQGDGLAALDLETGAIRWRAPLEDGARILRYGEDAAWFLSDLLRLSRLDLVDGSVEPGPEVFNRCLDGERILTLDEATLREEGGAPITEPLGLDGTLYACGRYDGALVVTVSEEDTFSLLRIRDGAVEARLRLDWDLRYNTSLLSQHEIYTASPLHGEMTRHLPLVLSRGAEDQRYDLIVVDLEEMQLKQATPHRDYLYFKHLRAGAMHYLWYHGGLLVAIDGQTGAISGGRAFSERQVAGNVVWMAEEGSEGWRPPRAPAAVWLDGRALALLGAAGETDAFSDAAGSVSELTGWPIQATP